MLVAALAGCGSSETEPGQSITVFAAASLQKTFTEIGEQFKTDNPGSSVDFNFAGSSDLVTQLTQGAAADVFASADTKNDGQAAQPSAAGRRPPVNFHRTPWSSPSRRATRSRSPRSTT